MRATGQPKVQQRTEKSGTPFDLTLGNFELSGHRFDLGPSYCFLGI